MYILAHAAAPVVPILLLRWRSPAGALARLPLPWLALGGLLPDLVDKPLGHLVLGYGHGRLWMHTLLATLAFAALALAGWRLSRRLGLVLAALALGVASHLVLDAMWGSPAILLWPLLGPMPRVPYDPIQYVTVLAQPSIYLSEGLAASVLVAGLLGARARRNAESRRSRTAPR